MMLYLHIPFCVRKCLYCDFCSLPGKDAADIGRYVQALTREMALCPCEETITSVFLGGGTPSLLPPESLKELFCAIRGQYALAPDCEISLEANPGTLTPAFLQAAREAGVNRLSIGVQAAQDELLKRLGRIHTFAQAQQAFALARQAGFQNLSADLMYDLPGQAAQDLLDSVDYVLGEGVSHVSMYALIVEENTPFGRMRRAGELDLPDEDAELCMQQAAIERLKQNGLLRYEVSNFAKEGFACRHNLGYWQRVPYLGLGLAAHGFDGQVRYANTADLDSYLAALSHGKLARETAQVLSPQEEWEETLMLGLRMTQGVRLPKERQAALSPRLAPLVQAGFVELAGDFLRLTDKGFPVMNAVLVKLL